MNYSSVLDTLQTWLNENHPDYQEGLAILMSYADKPALCKQLEQYHNPKKLYDSLFKLYELAKEKAANTIPTKSEARETVGAILEVARQSGTAPVKDKTIIGINQQVAQKIKEIDSLKATLFSIGRGGVNILRIKTLTDVRKEMLTGQPFTIVYCKYSEKRRTGGERASVANAMLFATAVEKEQLVEMINAPVISDVNRKSVTRDPNHQIHNTFNMRLNNGDIEKVRWLLIEEFNHFKVVM